MRRSCRWIIVCLVCLLAASCRKADAPSAGGAPVAASAESAISLPRLTIHGTSFQQSGKPFQWRGISAFRLLEQLAHGKPSDAEAFLDWASSQKLTVVRVLAMAHHLFQLHPDEGRAALPRLLEMAASRGLYVEIVALADTEAITADFDAHVKAIGEIAAKHPNTLVEIANEPGHQTQHAGLHRADRVEKLASLIPEPVPVALGSIEYGDGFAAGDYVTTHLPRDPGEDGWGHVRSLVTGAELIERRKKPVISDEPIGAAAKYVRGRRDNDPGRFRAAALLTRLTGMGATFHYEGGLQATIPVGEELACFDAWNEAWTLLPPGVEQQGRFEVAGSGSNAEYRRLGDREGWVLLLPPAREPQPVAGLEIADTRRLDGVTLVRVIRGGR
jgi:hypothetical protein